MTNPMQCWSANVKVPRALLLAAKPTFDSNPDGGVMITTGSIAVRPPLSFPSASRLVQTKSPICHPACLPS